MRFLQKNFVALGILLCGAVFAQAQSVPARMLSQDFYKRQDLCADAGRIDSSKKLILVLLATHLCDAGTHVCLDSLRTISDSRNAFIRDNFIVYQTRFYSYDMAPDANIYRLTYTAEKSIRQEWKKSDVNPEIVVIDRKSCRQLGRVMMADQPAALRGTFVSRYLALRGLILNMPGVVQILPGINEQRQIQMEIKRISNSDVRDLSLNQTYEAMQQASTHAGLQVGEKNLFLGGFPSVDRFIEAVRRKYNDPSIQLFITTSGVLAQGPL